MRKFIVLILITISSFVYSQNTLHTIHPVNYIAAQYPGGDSQFVSDFKKMIYAYIDMRMYAVNGKFTFIFDVDEKGKISNLDVVPKVKNSALFLEDMEFALKKVKKKWKPAIKDEKPISSNKVISIIFTSDHFDN